MKALPLAHALLLTAPLQGTILPIQQLDSRATAEFENYVSKWQSGSGAEFARSGRLWIDGQSGGRRRDFDGLREELDACYNANIHGGHIHHMFGTMRIPNIKLETVLKTVENYAKYPEYFKPDVTRSEANLQPDSNSRDQHYRIEMELGQATLWFDIALHGSYDAHYRRLDDSRVTTLSRSLNIREYKDAHNRNEGTYPEGVDHGLLWRTYTFWHIRERDGGVDMEVNSISLTRPIPLGLGWWAAKKARESIEKMINRTRAAIISNRP